MVADLHHRGIGADFRYDTRDLVAQHQRQRHAVVVIGEMQVAVAQAGALHLDEHLTTGRASDLDVGQLVRRRDRIDERSFHRFVSLD
ncbi:hypothetical protein [Microbacterium gubbeenense]|uniref:hypothetical protein n=1 Tax=Microbacterium gubbeenense TaxID=159896 RepID=UPI003F989897